MQICVELLRVLQYPTGDVTDLARISLFLRLVIETLCATYTAGLCVPPLCVLHSGL